MEIEDNLYSSPHFPGKLGIGYMPKNEEPKFFIISVRS